MHSSAMPMADIRVMIIGVYGIRAPIFVIFGEIRKCSFCKLTDIVPK